MNDLLQALEVSVMAVGLYEVWTGPLVDISERRDLELPELSFIHGRFVAGTLEKPSKAGINEGCTGDLKAVAEELSDIAIVEQTPSLEGQSMLMVLAPARPKKK